jgi:hypothetical protein
MVGRSTRNQKPATGGPRGESRPKNGHRFLAEQAHALEQSLPGELVTLDIRSGIKLVRPLRQEFASRARRSPARGSSPKARAHSARTRASQAGRP